MKGLKSGSCDLVELNAQLLSGRPFKKRIAPCHVGVTQTSTWLQPRLGAWQWHSGTAGTRERKFAPI